MIGFFSIRTEEGKRAWVRADEVGSFYETHAYKKPGPGRPPSDGQPKTIDVIALTLRHGNKLLVRDETLESVLNKMKQCLGTQIHLVHKAVFEGVDPVIERDDAA